MAAVALLFSRRALLALAVAASAALHGCATPSVPAGAKEALAPTGTLRVAVYPGSPTSLVEAAPPEAMRGASVDLGRALAARLGVPVRMVVLQRVAEVVAAIQKGDADFTVTNANPERAKLLDFTPPVLALELGYLVPAGSRIASMEGIDQPGVTVGVSQGSSSERTLAAQYKAAKLRAYPSLDAARAALQRGEIDAFATNKGVLHEQADRLPGARILEGRWGAEHLALATQKGRPAVAMAYLQSFAQEVRASGELEAAVKRAGLRGVAAP